ncbi:hypothetical protein BDZ91DRAFT_323184 [Kalaharituber pfeilii]|nr:hypothetical protein BDZ91DRAFT_323184 [Kalaharituber pfeilii]
MAPPIAPPSPRYDDDGRPRLAKHQSIHDWVNKREEQPPPPPLKIHGKTTTPPRTPKRDPPQVASIEPPKLNIRPWAFEPLESSPLSTKPANTNLETSSKIPVPKDASSDHISKTYTPKKSTPTDDILKSLAESLTLRPKEPTPHPDEAGPKDHITELEENRERLTARRVAIGKEIWMLEQSLDPTGANPYSKTSLTRNEIKELMEKKKLELAEVEKDIFDVGMLISRAWRRRCRNGEVSTHLWIHNVAERTD